MINKENTQQIGWLIGELVEVDLSLEGAIEHPKFLLFKTHIKIEKPIVPSFYYSTASGKKNWVNLKYEKLLDICYSCGVMGHLSRDFPKMATSEQE